MIDIIFYWTGFITWFLVGGCAIAQIAIGLTYRVLKTFGYSHEMLSAYWYATHAKKNKIPPTEQESNIGV